MGISESRGKKSLVHELRLRCLFRYPRSKPDSVIWLFLARSTSHPVVAQSDCTNIPLATGRAQEDETILRKRLFSHGISRFVRLDPPGLIGSWKISEFGSWAASGGFHKSAFDADTGVYIFPQRHQQLSGERHDRCFLQPTAIVFDSALEPQREG